MEVIKVTGDTFEETVIGSDVPVLVDFWATWCGPCRMMTPVTEALAAESDGKYKICSVNVDEEPALADRFGVNSIPMFISFSGGEMKGSTVGVTPKETLLTLLA
ncbi:MAG: thioredoxin [Firmicutes bacterium]|nr:thioredoxin [Bacillota bacterium]